MVGLQVVHLQILTFEPLTSLIHSVIMQKYLEMIRRGLDHRRIVVVNGKPIGTVVEFYSV